MRTFRTFLALLLLAAITAALLPAQKKKKRKKADEEEITQTHEIPKDPPAALSAQPQRLGFLAAPLSSKGLLSQQVRDGLKNLRSQARGASIIKVRAFVSGTGDLRRVPALVSEEFTGWRQPLPVVTAIRVGALPLEGAQVVLEGWTMEKRPVNPNGLAFFSGQQVTSKEPVEKVEPLFRESIANLAKAAKAAKVDAPNILRVTCFASALGDYMQLRQHTAAQFPKASLVIVQALRGLSSGLVECEAVGRLSSAPSLPMTAINPEALPSSPNYSQVMLVNAPKVILTGSQLAFHAQDADIRLAFDRLKKAVEGAGGSMKNTALTNYYPLAQSTIEKIRSIRFEFLDKARPPASTMLQFEGLPSMDASFALEVVTLP
ncbi:MAG: RidA family protein [Acidobacteria bacterium]|nr:RidA family protein [Acidobacteriota bacterium]